jgi:hypothetical protein
LLLSLSGPIFKVFEDMRRAEIGLVEAAPPCGLSCLAGLRAELRWDMEQFITADILCVV